MYEYKRKQSVLYLRHGGKTECPFWTLAGVGLDKITNQTDSQIREAIKNALFSTEMHDKHITIERDEGLVIAYTTGSNLPKCTISGCILRWKRG